MEAIPVQPCRRWSVKVQVCVQAERARLPWGDRRAPRHSSLKCAWHRRAWRVLGLSALPQSIPRSNMAPCCPRTNFTKLSLRVLPSACGVFISNSPCNPSVHRKDVTKTLFVAQGAPGRNLLSQLGTKNSWTWEQLGCFVCNGH